MTLNQILTPQIEKAIQQLYGATVDKVEYQATRKEFEGDITVVIFPFLRQIKGNPVEIGTKIGEYLVEHTSVIERFNVVKGFLNLVVSDSYYIDFFNATRKEEHFGYVTPTPGDKSVLVEYSSPNTNKPLHLGHVRNNLLGYSVAEILKASGKKVYKTQIINDRGIHICKSMLAWQKYGNGETPESTGLKGDKLVGNYYVKFDVEYKSQIKELMAQGMSEDEAKKEAPIIKEAKQMLVDWEHNKPEVIELWKTMNQWVYDGFAVSYKNLGVDFDKVYYESNTYLLGKDEVEKGLEQGVFFKKEDNSVWIDLSEEGLDEKLVLRGDGTSVYMTQDIGTAIQRVNDFGDVGGMVYTVGNEQDYHFKVLFLILKRLGFDWAESLYHLSYGMVELPSGKMKSREGTVVDADELIQEMTDTAKSISEELGKLEGYSEEERTQLFTTIGLGALKYFILKVDPRKGMMFNPKESVDFAGNTGPFIQYTYARIQSILRKADFDYTSEIKGITLDPKEKELLKLLEEFPVVIQDAARTHSPALIANYVYELVREYNSFYQTVSILGEEDAVLKAFRVQLSEKVGMVIKDAFSLLGIAVPDRM
ncbi:arginine--tRNA ligase [Myroides odoratimimus]|uniref:Arginine--tRNA ligase n=1 Tax=Myroides odoratimimus CCUG 10230 TaxID=883150 RepID=A0ABN0EAC5_9FLAO|nr:MULTISPECIES: arginine--tRNA ligase [Myroides]APA90767.1 arginine--tRNA ligase [Myroides sp. ZB35]EHO07169.1 arginyl-tRNA synthetase [Myroides odoratimimus CCUG 12901]EHO09359.1 arginyl-tRNA synthetase [Myroides odoratimimus CCUG 10230]EPH13941.1 arginyl-tRNA synthetase [Myroides odoratimimus CCUG 12700]MCO7724865.1 arginine--tRNA ligase [Myroides odoratimimus]